jgi:hypothetical protein
MKRFLLTLNWKKFNFFHSLLHNVTASDYMNTYVCNCDVFKKIVGLERGPLSLLSTTEELLDRKVAAPV